MEEFEQGKDIGLTATDDGRAPWREPYPPRSNAFAITSFVLAFFVTILSVIFGHIALSQIRRTGERGRGLALAGLWISYLSIIAAIVAVGIVWAMTVSAQNAYTNSLSHNSNGTTGSQAFGSAPTQYGTAPSHPAPTYSIPAPTPVVTGPAGVPRPLSSAAASNADRAYCQNRGVVLWLAESATYRGALCSIDGTTTLVSMSRDVGGNVVLPATADQDGYHAGGLNGTVYTFTKSSISVVTPSKTYQESTKTWEPGTSSLLTTPGDLGLSTPISYPACDESAIVVYGTSWNQATNASDVQKLLASKPGSKYMRTDLSCRSFRGPSTNNSGGEDVYAVYAAEPSAQVACQQIVGTSYYGRVLSNQREPGDNVLNC